MDKHIFGGWGKLKGVTQFPIDLFFGTQKLTQKKDGARGIIMGRDGRTRWPRAWLITYQSKFSLSLKIWTQRKRAVRKPPPVYFSIGLPLGDQKTARIGKGGTWSSGERSNQPILRLFHKRIVFRLGRREKGIQIKVGATRLKAFEDHCHHADGGGRATKRGFHQIRSFARGHAIFKRGKEKKIILRWMC